MPEIKFKDAYSLHINSYRGERKEQFNPEVSEQPIVFYLEILSSADESLVDISHSQEDKSVYSVDLQAVNTQNFQYIKIQTARIRKTLKQKHVQVLYPESQSTEARRFLACLFISPAAKATPEKAYRLIANETPSAVEIEFLENFRIYLGDRSKNKYNTTATIDKDSYQGKLKSEINETTESSNIDDLEKFKPARLTIRKKLLAITSTILIASITGLTFFSTGFFRSHSEMLIQDYNLSLARLIAQKIQSDIEQIVFRSPSTLENTANRQKFIEDYPEAAGMIVESNGFQVQQIHSFTDYSESDILRMHEQVQGMENAYNNQLVIRPLLRNQAGNENGLLNHVVIGIPYENDVILIFLHSEALLRDFEDTRQSDIFQLLIIDSQGNAVVAPEKYRNSSQIPVVQNMLTSPIRNGSQRFEYNEVDYLGSFQTMTLAGLGIVSMVETDRAFEAVYSVQKQNLAIMVFVVVLAFLFIYFFAKTITRPIINLARAIQDVEEGNYRPEIKPTSNDEVGMLTSSFISMSRGLEEREKIKDAFGKFVNPEIAEKALQGNIRLGGENKVATVLFSDIRNFTGRSEILSPEAVVDMLNEYFTDMVDCIHRTDGIIDKFIGDAVMATWGAVGSIENDALKSVQASLFMREALIRINKKRKNEGMDRLGSGVGINRGHVIAGQIGSLQRLEYTVIGDTVNLASRIEYLNKLFGTDILISESVYEEVKTEIQCRAMPRIQIKGKSEPHTVYAVFGFKSDSDTPASLSELRKRIGLDFDVEEAHKQLKTSSDILEDENADLN